jgi:xylulokinase
MSDYLLGFDIGTQSAKGMILDYSGRVVAEAVKPHLIQRPQAGWAEHDPEANYWESFKEITQSMLEESGIDAKDIKAIGVDALVPTMMAVDENDVALRNSILFIDNRAVKQLDEANEKLASKISLEKVVPKILWFKENEPDLYEKTKYFTLPHSYLVAKLTGKTVVDVDTANVYGEIFDVEKNDWDSAQCELLGIDKQKMPPAGPTNQIVGETTARAAQAGLPEGIPVIVGTGDSYASLVGYGAIHKGDMMIYLGTAGTQIMCKRELFDVLDSIHISDPGRTVDWKANMIACGQGLEWLRSKIAGEEYSYDRLNAEAAELPIGSDKLITLPHYMGIRTPEPDAVATGTVFGLGLSHTPVHMYRSLLEGLSFGMKQGMDAIEDPVKRIVVAGGGSNSDLWCQILSDALGRPVEVPRSGGAAMGIAYVAGVAIGAFSDFGELEQGWIQLEKSMEPNEENTKEYQKYYQIYLDLNEAVAPLYRPLYDL